MATRENSLTGSHSNSSVEPIDLDSDDPPKNHEYARSSVASIFVDDSAEEMVGKKRNREVSGKSPVRKKSKTEHVTSSEVINVEVPRAYSPLGNPPNLIVSPKTNTISKSNISFVMWQPQSGSETSHHPVVNLNRKDQSEEVAELKGVIRRQTDLIIKLLIEQSKTEFEQLEQRVATNIIRLGKMDENQEAWEYGSAMFLLDQKLENISTEREVLKNIEKTHKPAKPSKTATHQSENTKSKFFQLEFVKAKLSALKAEEKEVQTMREKVEKEITAHARDMKLLSLQKNSAFNKYQLLKNQYQMLNLLGRGGFSEVYLAFDVKNLRKVACKIHQVGKDWKADRRDNYMKHATREHSIHKSLDHPNIVRFLNNIDLSADSFCTVLEYCDEGDLDMFIKSVGKINEKDTCYIISQVVSALVYLHEKSVIHYDLKPGNILFHEGNIKITDFGLSKQNEGNSRGNMTDLTSQGAGTYSYLPPECFKQEKPRISNKVDIWSIGVICYQMLFGTKPFDPYTSDFTVKFPAATKPPVSAVAKQFIQDCLTENLDERPDVNELAKHEFIQKSQFSAS